jgi:hypothetical protein
MWCDRDGVWIGHVAPEKRESAPVIIQQPKREEAPEESRVNAVVTMGVAIQPPDEGSTVTIANTKMEGGTERFAAFDVDLIDDVIAGLQEVKERVE